MFVVAISIAIGELGDKTFLASIGLGIQYPFFKFSLILGEIDKTDHAGVRAARQSFGNSGEFTDMPLYRVNFADKDRVVTPGHTDRKSVV